MAICWCAVYCIKMSGTRRMMTSPQNISRVCASHPNLIWLKGKCLCCAWCLDRELCVYCFVIGNVDVCLFSVCVCCVHAFIAATAVIHEWAIPHKYRQYLPMLEMVLCRVQLIYGDADVLVCTCVGINERPTQCLWSNGPKENEMDVDDAEMRTSSTITSWQYSYRYVQKNVYV